MKDRERFMSYNGIRKDKVTMQDKMECFFWGHKWWELFNPDNPKKKTHKLCLICLRFEEIKP